MAALEALIGSEILGKDGDKVKTEALAGEGKVLGLYFSAHWCPPCRGFTPELAKWYETIKSSKNGDKFDIVFVSSDRDQSSFDEYFKEMPWKALPYEDRDTKGKLSKKFKVSGIPSLVFVNAGDGKLITADGRSVVGDDPSGEKFPWVPKTFKEMFTGELLKDTEGGKTTIEEATKGKVVGLYFSAHWCPPCKSFTPLLADTYKTLKEQGKNFEVIFLSSDRSEDSFNEYFKTMPWLSLPFNDDRKKELSRHFDVGGIPTLILLDEDQHVITDNGRGAVNADKTGEKFPWVPEPLALLTGDSVSAVNETPCLIFFTDGKAENVDLAKLCLFDIATEEAHSARERRKAGEDVEAEVLFFYEGDDDEDTVESLRSYLNLEERSPMLMLLDIPDAKKFILPKDEQLNKQRVQELLSDYRAGKLDMLPLRGS